MKNIAKWIQRRCVIAPLMLGLACLIASSHELNAEDTSSSLRKSINELIELFPKSERKGMKAYTKALSFQKERLLTNDSYNGFRSRKLMIEIVALKKESELENFVCQALAVMANLECHTASSTFRDILEISPDELFKLLKEQHFDSYLLIDVSKYDVLQNHADGYSHLFSTYLMKGVHGEILMEGTIRTTAQKSEYIFYDYVSLGSMLPLLTQVGESGFIDQHASTSPPLDLGTGIFREVNIRCRNFFRNRAFATACVNDEALAMKKIGEMLSGADTKKAAQCLAEGTADYRLFRRALACANEQR